MIKVADIAKRFDATVEGGDPRAPITGVAGIREAGAGDLTFLSDKRYRGSAAKTCATAMLAPMDWRDATNAAVVRVPDPEAAFMSVAECFAPPVEPAIPGVHESAVIGRDVDLGAGVSIGPHCVVGNGCRIGCNSVLVANCVLGAHVTIGADCCFYPMVSVREHCRLGDRVVLHNGVVIGSDGFGYHATDDGWRKIPQTGIVVMGDDIEIGANTAVDRARFGVTRIENGVKIDNLVQIAHNVTIGAHSAIAGMSALAGSAMLGRNVQMGGNSAVSGHLQVGDGAVVAGRAGVTKDVAPGQFVSGFPAMPHDRELRMQAHVMRLPHLKKRVAELEQRIRELERKESS